MNKEILTIKDRYELVIKARNFHYDNFNKWMTYFYVMIAALFIGLYNILGKSNTDCKDSINKDDLLLIVSSLGFIFSLCWHWANKGYYYWNINFIMLVNHYEQDLLQLPKEERVYFVFANKSIQNDYHNPISGANFSTSKISILVSYLVTNLWAIGFIYLFHIQFWVKMILTPFCPVIILLLTLLAKPYLYSKIDHFPDLKLDQKVIVTGEINSEPAVVE